MKHFFFFNQGSIATGNVSPCAKQRVMLVQPQQWWSDQALPKG